MSQDNDSRNRATKRIRWIARIWSLPLIAYALLMFAGYAWNWVTTGVADPHTAEGYSPIEALPLILLFLSVLGLGIAWRWERLGGVITLVFLWAVLLLLLVQTPIARDFPRSAVPYLMSLLVAIPGVLFVVCGRRSRGGNP